MLGALRFFLATCVVLFHLTQLVPHIGILAVNFFYVISGYLITLILNESYQFGFARFAANRFLRLYPTYFVLALLAAVLHQHTFGAIGSSPFHPSWSGDLQSGDAWGNALIFPWAILSDPLVHVTSQGSIFYSEVLRYRLIPSTWSVGVEITCYFLLWLFCARNVWFAVLTFLSAIAWHSLVYFSEMDIAFNYYPVTAALLPFSLGAISYFIAKKINSNYYVQFLESLQSQVLLLSLMIGLFIANWYLSLDVPNGLFRSKSFYLNNLIAMGTVIAFHKSKTSGLTDKICKWLGDLSYPVFLAHYLGAYIGWHLIGMPANNRGWDIFIIGFPITLLLSVAIVIFVDRPVSKLRAIIRPIKVLDIVEMKNA